MDQSKIEQVIKHKILILYDIHNKYIKSYKTLFSILNWGFLLLSIAVILDVTFKLYDTGIRQYKFYILSLEWLIYTILFKFIEKKYTIHYNCLRKINFILININSDDFELEYHYNDLILDTSLVLSRVYFNDNKLYKTKSMYTNKEIVMLINNDIFKKFD